MFTNQHFHRRINFHRCNHFHRRNQLLLFQITDSVRLVRYITSTVQWWSHLTRATWQWMLTRCWRTKHTKRRNYYVASSPHTPHSLDDADLDAGAVYDANVDDDAEEPNIASSYVLLIRVLDADAKTLTPILILCSDNVANRGALHDPPHCPPSPHLCQCQKWRLPGHHRPRFERPRPRLRPQFLHPKHWFSFWPTRDLSWYQASASCWIHIKCSTCRTGVHSQVGHCI